MAHSCPRHPAACMSLLCALTAAAPFAALADASPADPSGTLSIRIPTTENDASGFFSLRVNILDDDSDIR